MDGKGQNEEKRPEKPRGRNYLKKSVNALGTWWNSA